MKQRLNVKNNIRRYKFLNETAKIIVEYMKTHNIPLLAVFREDIIKLIPKCHNTFTMIDWKSIREDDQGNRSYSSMHYILLDDETGEEFTAKPIFVYSEIKYRILRAYITHNITWR